MSTTKAVFHIGSDTIDLTVQDDQYANHFLFHASLPYSGFCNGSFLKKQELYQTMVELIRRSREQVSAEVQEYLIGIPSEFTTVVIKTVETNFVNVHKITEADLDKLLQDGNTYDEHPVYMAINASAIQYVLDSGMVSMMPVGETARSLRCTASYVLAERSCLDQFRMVAEACAAKFEFMSELSAELMYIVPPEVRDRGVILVDSGYISTGVAYGKGDGLLHSVGFSMGTGHVASDLCYVYESIPFAEAMKITAQLNLNMNYSPTDVYRVDGSNPGGYPVSQINPVAICRVEEIANKIAEAIAASRMPIPADAEVMLTGCGIANMQGAKDILARVLKRNVHLLRPNCLNLDKPKDSAMAALLRVQQESMPVHSWRDNINRFLQNFRRKKSYAK